MAKILIENKPTQMIDYEKEYEILTHQLEETKKELEEYKQALKNACLCMRR